MRYFAFIILIFLFASCDKKIIDNLGSDLPLNKEFVIENGSTKNNLEENISLQMVSVVNDSRCPSLLEFILLFFIPIWLPKTLQLVLLPFHLLNWTLTQ